jgi:tetratricopeptide (TPR) repeat protein
MALASSSMAQVPPLVLPEASQKATVSQTIGLTDISISYHRPGVNKRKVWGGLVPHNEVWRAGANENTVLAVTTPVSIGGKTLPAGKYGLHFLPTEKDWTLILSNESHAWGSFSYDPKEDALRVSVTPVPADLEERLLYTLDDPTDNAVTANLRWEKLKVSFKIQVDIPNAVFENVREQMRGLPRFYWQGWNQAAAWCLRNNTHLDEALKWSDESLKFQENFQNLRTKAALLEKKGDAPAAAALREKAQKIATEADINLQAYQLLGSGKTDEAIEVFRKNAKTYPGSWNAFDSLGEALADKGDKAGAIASYGKALELVKDDTQKKRIEGEIKKLR